MVDGHKMIQMQKGDRKKGKDPLREGKAMKRAGRRQR